MTSDVSEFQEFGLSNSTDPCIKRCFLGLLEFGSVKSIESVRRAILEKAGKGLYNVFHLDRVADSVETGDD